MSLRDQLENSRKKKAAAQAAKPVATPAAKPVAAAKKPAAPVKSTEVAEKPLEETLKFSCGHERPLTSVLKKKCPKCREDEHQAILEQRKRPRPIRPKKRKEIGRLPSNSTFSKHYNAEKVEWTVILTVPDYPEIKVVCSASIRAECEAFNLWLQQFNQRHQQPTTTESTTSTAPLPEAVSTESAP